MLTLIDNNEFFTNDDLFDCTKNSNHLTVSAVCEQVRFVAGEREIEGPWHFVRLAWAPACAGVTYEGVRVLNQIRYRHAGEDRHPCKFQRSRRWRTVLTY